MRHMLRIHQVTLAVGLLYLSSLSSFFRRDRNRPSRADAYRDLFSALATLYEAAARLRPDWRDAWRDRREHELPPKYNLDDKIVADAAHDVRYATMLLRRYRWKSVVQPLFEEIDEPAWQRFVVTASELSPTLLALADRHTGLLGEDETDWINTAVEQLDEATRRRRMATNLDVPRAQQIAESAYQPIFIAIHLTERLIERRSYELSDR